MTVTEAKLLYPNSPIVFKSVNQTDDATYDSQDSVCRSEGGKLLPRLTQANLKDLVYYCGLSIYFFSFLSNCSI